jgi:hypothetical protein
MNSLSKKFKRACAGILLASATLFGASTAMAQEAENTQTLPKLTDDQQYAIDMTRQFNACVVDMKNDPEWKEIDKLYQEELISLNTQYEQILDNGYNDAKKEWDAKVQKIQEEYFIKMVNSIANKDLQDALINSLVAAGYPEDEAKVLVNRSPTIPLVIANEMMKAKPIDISAAGPAPEKPPKPVPMNPAPADPVEQCNKEMTEQMRQDGKHPRVIPHALQSIYRQYGETVFKQLINRPSPK